MIRRLTVLLALALPLAVHADGAPGRFDPKGSDPRAIAAVDRVQRALGMPGAWRKAHYIEYTFGQAKGDTLLFGRRHRWDTWTGHYRLEGDSRQTKQHYVVIFPDIADPAHAGVWLDGVKQDADTTVAKWVKLGYGAFINDSYWLLMPYKMKDPGVHLAWFGQQTDSTSGRQYTTVGLSFDAVGLTPGDRYTVWIDPATSMVARWKYISGANPDQTMVSAWEDYHQVGPLRISGAGPSPAHPSPWS